MTSPRLLLIGLDGLEPSLADAMIKEGKLENLRRLRDDSARFELDHGVEKFSGLTWEHFSAGHPLDADGRWSAVHLDTNTYEAFQLPTQSTPFLAELPRRSVVFDVPYFDITKAPDVQGAVGWGAHDAGVPFRAQPVELGPEMEARFGEFVGGDSMYGFSWPSPSRTERHGANLVQAARQRADVAEWLFTERFPEWDVAVVVAGEMHSAIEPMWHGFDANHPLHSSASAEPARQAVIAVYEEVDRMIGRLRDALPDVVVLAFAMHGMGPNDADVASFVLLPELLHRRQFGESLLQPRSDWEVGAPAPLGEDEPWAPAVTAQIRHRPRRWASLRRRLRPLPRPHISEQRRDGAVSMDWMPSIQYQRYWPDMEVFSVPGYYHGRVRFNLKGRESRGKVALADYDRLAREVTALLEACRNPADGSPAVKQVERFVEAEPLDMAETDADLDVIWNGNPVALEHPELGLIGPVPHRRTGGHTGAHGVAWLNGPSFEPGDRGGRSSFDVVPTVFDVLGEAVPADVAGHSLLGEAR